MSDGQLDISSIPQMVTLTFNGAVNIDNILLYDKLFNEERLNPNGCTARGTFFVSHKYTNYSAVQELHRCAMILIVIFNATKGYKDISFQERPRDWRVLHH